MSTPLLRITGENRPFLWASKFGYSPESKTTTKSMLSRERLRTPPVALRSFYQIQMFSSIV
ncbi:hypothetical protein YC2023_066626 [Brassica napus]